ncbi:MAG TPA: hypothetical protein VF720_02845 [Candidatus Eisenbacteria bacterium]
MHHPALMQAIADALRAHTELALFLAVAAGQALGRLRLGSVRMNPVLATLLVGILVGQLGLVIPLAMQYTFFVLFLFSVGFKSGPQFFRTLGPGAVPHVVLTILLAALSVGVAVWGAHLVGLDAGGSAGLLAGGMSSSTAVGTAGDAITRLSIGEDARHALQSNLSVVYSLAYICGFITELIVLTRVAPWLMRVNLAEECRKLEKAMGVERTPTGVFSAHREAAVRAYRIPEGFPVRSAVELERMFAPARVFVERIRRGTGIVDAEWNAPIDPGDLVALTGRHEVLVEPENPLRAHETDDRELLDIPAVIAEVVVTGRWPAGRTLGDLIAENRETPALRSVFIRSITRAGESIPMGPGTVPERGDVISLAGPPSSVSQAAALFGRVEWPSVTTDLISVALAIAVGGLIGIPTLLLFGIHIGLSVPVGVLLAGLVVGWLRSVRPVFGRIPEPALWVFDTMGLSGFIAIIGINAGPGFVKGFLSLGPAILLASVAIRIIPNVVTLFVGRKLFRLHPGILLGILAGAGCSSAGLAALKEDTQSEVPTLGYGMAYALANVLLGLGATILVTLLSR